MSTRKESGEITSDRKGIIKKKNKKDFYKSLCIQTVLTPVSTLTSSPDTKEIPKPSEEKVERAIKRIKRHKVPGKVEL